MTILNITSWGEGPLLVLCHGFTQTSTSWGHFGDLLGRHHSIVAVDLPGHGASRNIDADLEETAKVLEATIGEQPFDLLGYSLGGRVALTTALMRPAGLQRLVLIGATAGISDESLRSTRRERDDALASEIVTEDDLGAFLDRWSSQALFSTLRPDPRDRASRLQNTPSGLAQSLRRMGVGTQRPSWSELGSLATPTLLLAGARDDRFVDIARTMATLMADATFSVVPGAGHACHLEQPALCASIVEHWLAGTHPMARPAAKSAPTRS